MNYIYDILLNFNRQLYDFFEWDINDNIVHIRKIPLYKVGTKQLLKIRDNRIKFEQEFLDKVKNKTEVFTNKDVEFLEYAFLFTDGSTVLALKCNESGESAGKSMLLVDEDMEVLDVSKKIKETEIEFEIMADERYIPLKTRKEQKMEKYVKDELYKSQKQNANEKLKYLYFECFGKNECSIETILNHFNSQMRKGNYSMIRKLYDFFKLTSVQK